MKDKAAAQTLVEELEVARLGHPTSRQDISFSSRAAALVKRMQLREDPSSASSLFPRPTHPLFPDQPTITDAAIALLSSELASAMEQVQKAEVYAKDYHTALEAVKQVEGACKAASALSSQYDEILVRLQTGVPAERGDGTPPDLSRDACLDETRHAVFLAALPTIMQELQHADTDAADLLPSARVALLHLDHLGIDPQFKTDSEAEVQRLASVQQVVARVREEVCARAETLDITRKVWGSIKQAFSDSEELRRHVAAAVEKQMWRQQLQSSEAPPTPESPSSLLPHLTISPGSVLARVDRMQAQLKQDVSDPITIVTPSIGPPLVDHLAQFSSALDVVLENLRRSARFWDAVRNQSAAMEGVRDDAQVLQVQLEDLKVRFDSGINDVLSGTLAGDELLLTEGGLSGELKRCQDAVRGFNHALPRRVTFVGDDYTSTSPSQRHLPSISGFDLDTVRRAGQYDLPVDPRSLDNAVRTDSNGYSLLLSGVARQLEQKSEHFQLAKTAKAVDVATSTLLTNIQRVVVIVASLKQTLADPAFASDLKKLEGLANEVDQLNEIDGLEISRSFSPVRGLLHRLQSMPDSAGFRDNMVQGRQCALDDVERQYLSWKESTVDLRRDIARVRDAQRSRLEQLRLEQERAHAAVVEQERLATEAEARARAESEQVGPAISCTLLFLIMTSKVESTTLPANRSSGGQGEQETDRQLETVTESDMESSVTREANESGIACLQKPHLFAHTLAFRSICRLSLRLSSLQHVGCLSTTRASQGLTEKATIHTYKRGRKT